MKPKYTARMLALAEEFFYNNAGFSWNSSTGETEEEGHRRCAESLARAEEWLMGQDNHVVEWMDDSDADRSFLEPDDGRPLFGCVVQLQCPHCKAMTLRESLWGIDLGPTGTECDSYKRVLVAELALELMPKE